MNALLRTCRRAGPLLLAAFALHACSDGPSAPPKPASLQAVGTVPGTAAVGSVVTPAVRVTDAQGNPVAGTTVSFAVTGGGGTIENASAVTNSDGIALPGAWTLGMTTGPNTLVASFGSLAPVTFSVTTTAITIEKFAGDATTCPVNRDGCVFSVRVLLPDGQPVSGEAVTWSNGTGPDINTVTNLRGIATAGNIAPNSATGARTQTATLVSSGASTVFNYTLVPDAGYNIVIRYIGNIPNASVQAAFEQARLHWQSIITGDLPNINMVVPDSMSVCGIDNLGLNEVVDDLLILAVIDSIDGPGKILGSAGPCYIRSASSLPIVGLVRLDTADLAQLDSNGLMEDVILHEIGHTFGFPALWGPSFFDLLVGDTTSANPYYTGLRARMDFVVAGGTLINGVGVPVENTGQAGTRLGHWRESVLSNELMTGFIGGTHNPLSRITVGALMDLGYQVNFGAADAYMLPGASLRATAGPPALELRELHLPPPQIVR